MLHFHKNRSRQDTTLKWYQRFKLGDIPQVEVTLKKINNLRFEQKILWGNAIAVVVFFSVVVVGVQFGNYSRHQADKLQSSLQQERRLLNELRNHCLSFEELIEFPSLLQTARNEQQTRSQIMQRIQRTRQIQQVLSSNPQLITFAEYGLLRSQYQTQQNLFFRSLETSLTRHQNQKTIESGQITANRQFIHQLSRLIKKVEQQELKAEQEFTNSQIINLIIIIGFVGVSLILTYYVSLFWSRKLVYPLVYTASKAQSAINELEKTPQITSSNEIESLTTALNILIAEHNSLKQEYQIAQAQIEAALSAKTRFLANISHELRTPLNGILGYAQMMMRSPDLNSEHQRGITTIYNCGSHLLDLINDILDFSKFETDKIELNPVNFHFPSFCQGIIESCRVQAEQKGLKLIYQPAFNLPLGIHTDKNRLRQVITSLINYAVKSTNEGHVRLKIQAFPYPHTQGKQVINIKISQTGIFLTEETIKRLFSPFENVYNHTPQGDEPGLAIALSQKIIQKMGGKLKIKSKPAVGTSFSFSLVCSIPNDWTEGSTISNKRKIIGYTGAKKQILIVDDSWENRSILIGLLEPLNFIILEANHGQDGYIQAEKFQPDLIISDIGMPIMDGWELLAKIRQSPALENTKFVVYSTNLSAFEQQNNHNKGVDDFLAKPIQVEQLYTILSKQLNLTWSYANQSVDDTYIETQEEIIIPPFTVIASLLEFAKRGQIRGIQDELDKIDLLDAKYAKFVKKLRYYTQTFNIQKIRDFLHKNIRK